MTERNEPPNYRIYITTYQFAPTPLNRQSLRTEVVDEQKTH